MPTLSLYLLGSLTAEFCGRPIASIESNRGRALLAYLALESERPHPREALATLLWPDANPQTARQNLRRVVYNLRQATETQAHAEPFLHVTRRDVQFNAASDYWLDVTAFTGYLDACDTHPRRQLTGCDACRAHLRQAIDLYRGDFLAGFSLPDSLAFDAWYLGRQQHLHQRAMLAFHHLATSYEQVRDDEQAVYVLQRQTELAPWHEEGHRQLMRVLALSGQRQGALQQYDICRQQIAAHLGVKPDTETRALYRRIRQARLTPPPVVRSKPYKGLHTFTEADADDFFGREAFVTHLLAMVSQQPFVAILGASGSGKSSIVHAGLLPRLRAPERVSPIPALEPTWLTIGFRPGSAPFQTLAEALSAQLDHLAQVSPFIRQTRAAGLAKQLRGGEVALQQVVEQLQRQTRARTPCRLLLLIDQFEELYTLCAESSVRRAFIDCLLTSCDETSERTNLCILITMRADFMGQVLASRPFADRLQASSLLLGPMHREEMQRAIEEPARRQRVVFEAGLVEQLLRDVGEEPGNLPLLEFALALLWEQLEGDTLTYVAYRDIGGVDGALVRYADQLYSQFDPDEQWRVQRLLTQLVRPGEGTEDTRLTVSRTELEDSDWPLVQELADARLVVTNRTADGEETVEIVHEALISTWGRLRAWLNADRDFYTWRQRLRSAIRQWADSSADPGALLRGIPLAEAEHWMAERHVDLSPAERDFIATSVEAEATQRERERQQAQALARAAAVSQSLNLATNARLALNDRQTDLALALGREANRIEDPPPQAQLMLADIAYVPGARQLFTGHEGPVMGVALSADGQRAISASADRSLRLWDVDRGTMLRCFKGHTDAVTSVALSHCDSRALSASADHTLILWDVNRGEMLRRFEGHRDAVLKVAMHPDGRRALSASADRTLVLWDIASGAMLRRFVGHTDVVNSVAFSPDGCLAISGSSDFNIYVWDVETGAPIHHLCRETQRERPDEVSHLPGGHSNVVQDVAFGPHGTTAASVSWDLTVMYWNVITGEPLHRIEMAATSMWSVCVGPHGRRLIVGTQDSRIIVLDVGGLQQTILLRGHRSRVRALALTPDGRTLLSGADDGTLRLWDLRSGLEIRQLTYYHWFQSELLSTPQGSTPATRKSTPHQRVLYGLSGV